MSEKHGPQVERLQAVAGSASGRLIAIGGRRDASNTSATQVHVFEGNKVKPKFAIDVDSPVLALAFVDGDLLVVADEHGRLTAFDVSADEVRRAFVFDGASSAHALARDSSGRRLAAGFADGRLVVFTVEPTRLVPALERPLFTAPIRAVAFDDTTETVAAAGDDGIIATVVGDGEPRRMPCGEGGVFALVFTGDGRIAAGCGDGSVRLCFLDGAIDEEDRSADDAHGGPVTALILGPIVVDEAKKPKPRRLHSAGADGELKSWFIDSRRKPKITTVGDAVRGAAWLAPSRSAKAEVACGRIVLARSDRRLTVIDLDDTGTPAASMRIGSRFDHLEADLSARGNQVRIDAVDALGALAEDEARVLLDRALLNDDAPEVRRCAAANIRSSNRRRSRPALRQALNDKKPEARGAAFDALCDIEKDTPLAPLRAALAAQHPDLRIRAIGRLPALRSVSPLVFGLIADALSDANDKVRAAALDALFVLEGESSITPVRTALERGPADVRIAALLRLGRAKRARAADENELIERSLDDVDADVRRTAFYIAVGARPRLARALAAVDSAARKALAELQAAGPFADASESGKPTEVDLVPLFAAMACQRADSALLGARSLAAISDARAIGALLQLSRETDREIRYATVEALHVAAMAIASDEQSTARLSWLLDDEDERIANAAFDALLELAAPAKDEGKLDHAALALGAARENIRHRGLQLVVGHPGVERASTLLGQALDDESSKVRQEALRTLLAWHAKSPKPALERGATSRHADVRKTVIDKLAAIQEPWARALLLAHVADASADVGLAALTTLTKTDEDKRRAEVFLMAMHSPRPEVRAAGCKGCHRAPSEDLRPRLLELIDEERPAVHLAAIEAADRLMPTDSEAFRRAFGSVFYELRVYAGELLGKRRDKRAVEPMQTLLTIPAIAFNRPDDRLRQRAARALADVGDSGTIPFLVTLLDDEDGVVREMGARGLATACRPGREKPLLDALAHADLAVRSWAAEGLARLGDSRAQVVLAGTLNHEHRPIRVGAILGHVALGPDGIRGLLAGLQDPDREVQDFTLAIILARDIALARDGLDPDLLLAAVSAAHPEIRFAAARALEARSSSTVVHDVAKALVGPKRPERAAEMKNWPSEEDQQRLLDVVVSALASDHPEQRYAAARVLELRAQPAGYWREAKRLAAPGGGARPHTNFEDERSTPTKKGWLRKLFGRPVVPVAKSRTERVLSILKNVGALIPRAVPAEGAATDDALLSVVFGTYAGLVRQAPPAGEADETHRVRRDSIERLTVLAGTPTIGRDAVLPVVSRALSDPSHLVRRRAASALNELYPADAVEPLLFQLDSDADDVGRAAVEQVIERAIAGDAKARAIAPQTLSAKSAKARAHALSRLPRLFEANSLEPWFIALESPHADVRLLVVDRLDAMPTSGADEARIGVALGRALESDHEDLRMKAAQSLARRGDARTADVLAAFLRAEDAGLVRRAVTGLLTLARANAAQAAVGAQAIASRIEDDPDHTADRRMLITTLGEMASPAADELLFKLLADEDEAIGNAAWTALVAIARDNSRPEVVLREGGRRARYDEQLALTYARLAAEQLRPDLRIKGARLLRDVDDSAAESILAKLLDDREELVRVAAAETLAFRAEHVDGATVSALEKALAGARRELVLPAALGLAKQSKTEAFRPLMLVFKAGLPEERERAVLGLGELADNRAIDELMALVDPRSELDEGDTLLVFAAAEALAAMLSHIDDAQRAKEVRETVERLARQGDARVRQRAIIGLRKAGDDSSRHTIERVASDRYDDRQTRQVAIEQLALLENEGSELALADILVDNDRHLRAAALAALSKIFEADPTRVALHGLDSPHADINGPAATFLADGGDPKTLVARIAGVLDPSVRQRLRRGLVRRRLCPEAELERLLQSDRPGPRAEAAWIVGGCAAKSLAPSIVGAASRAANDWAAKPDDGIADAWLAALWAANRIEADARTEAVRALETANAPAAVKAEALRFLERFGGHADVAIATAAVSSPHAEVRTAAAATVAKLAPDQAAKLLTQLAVADVGAIGTLVDVALPDSAAALLESDAGRQLVLSAVIKRGRVEELAALAKRSGTTPARTMAIATLGRMGGDAAQAALQSILDESGAPDAIRAATFKALRRAQRATKKHAEAAE